MTLRGEMQRSEPLPLHSQNLYDTTKFSGRREHFSRPPGGGEFIVLSLGTLALFFQAARPHRSALMAVLRHLGAPGLFLVAILDGTPIPTLGGPDILNMILAVHHADPWYDYATAAALGSVVGAYLNFRVARRAGSVYLEKKFGPRRVAVVLKYFERWGTGILALSCLIPFPFPTSAFFAAAGVLEYPSRKFVRVVAMARVARYFVLAALAAFYGRHFIHIVRHPGEHAAWFLLIALFASLLTAGALFVQQAVRRQTV
jgi:membrane protein YqaA with SNARE-associated domain